MCYNSLNSSFFCRKFISLLDECFTVYLTVFHVYSGSQHNIGKKKQAQCLIGKYAPGGIESSQPVLDLNSQRPQVYITELMFITHRLNSSPSHLLRILVSFLKRRIFHIFVG